MLHVGTFLWVNLIILKISKSRLHEKNITEIKDLDLRLYPLNICIFLHYSGTQITVGKKDDCWTRDMILIGPMKIKHSNFFNVMHYKTHKIAFMSF